MLTRETKAGLVVSLSFLCLVGVVLYSKMRSGHDAASRALRQEDEEFKALAAEIEEPAPAADIKAGMPPRPAADSTSAPPTQGAALMLVPNPADIQLASVTQNDARTAGIPAPLPATPVSPLPAPIQDQPGPRPETAPTTPHESSVPPSTPAPASTSPTPATHLSENATPAPGVSEPPAPAPSSSVATSAPTPSPTPAVTAPAAPREDAALNRSQGASTAPPSDSTHSSTTRTGADRPSRTPAAPSSSTESAGGRRNIPALPEEPPGPPWPRNRLDLPPELPSSPANRAGPTPSQGTATGAGSAPATAMVPPVNLLRPTPASPPGNVETGTRPPVADNGAGVGRPDSLPESTPSPTLVAQGPPAPIGAEPFRPVPPVGTPASAGSPPIAVPTLPANTMTAQVEAFDELMHMCKQDDTFASISNRYYLSEKYARALQLFNRDHPRATDGVRQQQPVLQPGQPVYVPPLHILERKHAAEIPGFTPLPAGPAATNPATTPANTVIPSPTYPLPLASDAPASTATANPTGPASSYAPLPAQPIPPSPAATSPAAPPAGTALQGDLAQPRPTTVAAPSPTTGNAWSTPTGDKLYRVRQNGELMREIAGHTLGNKDRWPDIYKLNQRFKPEYPVPQGVVLRLPTDARVGPEDAP